MSSNPRFFAQHFPRKREREMSARQRSPIGKSRGLLSAVKLGRPASFDDNRVGHRLPDAASSGSAAAVDAAKAKKPGRMQHRGGPRARKKARARAIKSLRANSRGLFLRGKGRRPCSGEGRDLARPAIGAIGPAAGEHGTGVAREAPSIPPAPRLADDGEKAQRPAENTARLGASR